MHYYKFNLSDYITATAHLSPLEDIAYRRLIDYYYEKESPIPNETEWVSKRIRMASEVNIITSILAEFFTLTDENVWVHDVCESNIMAYQARSKTNKANSLKGGRPKKTHSVSTRNQIETLTNNHKPITNNQELIKENKQKKKSTAFKKPTVSEITEYLKEKKITSFSAEQFFNHYEANGWMRGKTKIKSWKACVSTWVTNNRNNNQSEQQENYQEFPA